jgi:hypothetical protein
MKNSDYKMLTLLLAISALCMAAFAVGLQLGTLL